MNSFDMEKYFAAVNEIDPFQQLGRVTQVVGLLIESHGPRVNLGDLCYISSPQENLMLPAEVVGFRQSQALLMPLGEMHGIGPGCSVISARRTLRVNVGHQLLGRVLDGLGNPIDGGGPILSEREYPLHAAPPSPLSRKRITEPISVGVRAIDGLLTLGRGQRIGIMAGSGVGKSTLLGMMARNTEADISVIALIGERGREVREFLERDLGEEGLKRSVVVVATSDQPALLRLKGAMTATAVAEYFRDQGLNVMLMMDSVTRFAVAQREVGLTVGEPPATRGYTPSVFALLPKLLERTGASDKGSITGIYTVLVDGDDMNEPISDTVRSILDGHIVLSRSLASQNHYPAIDILQSVSRLMLELVDQKHWQKAQLIRTMLAVHRDAEDLINIGAYAAGSNPNIDQAIDLIGPIRKFLQQDVFEKTNFALTRSLLSNISG
ncbi:MAG TPA: flagellar protein export ATPase FliI [Selenomonadales bacterium]|nr:flagellar protein export ATPase FliI [Selenomonadales bacterium]